VKKLSKKGVKLNEEEQQLRILGVQFARIIRDIEIFEREIANLREHVMALGMQIENLQREAEVKRLEKEAEKRTGSKS